MNFSAVDIIISKLFKTNFTNQNNQTNLAYNYFRFEY